MNEIFYFAQVFVIHLFCAVVGIANVVSTAVYMNWVRHSFPQWQQLTQEAILAVTLWVIWFKGDWYQNASMFTGLGAGVLLVLVWRMHGRK